MRIAIVVFALAMLASPLAAQQRLPSLADARMLDPLVVDSMPSQGHRAPLPQGAFEAQVMSGLAWLAVGALAGGLGAVSLVDSDGPSGAVGPFVGGMLLGSVVGATAGIHVASQRYGLRSNPLATLAGSVIGFAGGPFFFVTVPVGGAMAHNAFRR